MSNYLYLYSDLKHLYIYLLFIYLIYLALILIFNANLMDKFSKNLIINHLLFNTKDASFSFFFFFVLHFSFFHRLNFHFHCIQY